MQETVTETEVRHLRELMDERAKALELALRLQAVEYGRRLDALNHEHARTAKVLADSVTRERFDDFLRADRLARDAALLRVDEQLAAIEQSVSAVARDVSNMQGRAAAWTAASTVGLALFALALRFVV